MPETGAAAIRTRYTGKVAEAYEGERDGQPNWAAENAAMEKWLGVIGAGASVLDIPVGTGRFLHAYQRHGLTAIGMDVSADMLVQAHGKLTDVDLRLGDILAIDLPDASVDAAIAVRIMNWLTIDEVRIALGELARVARTWIITAGGRSDERSALVRGLAGFDVADEALIERHVRGDYSLVLLRRA